MSFLDLIEHNQSIIPTVIEDLKTQSLPLVLLGAGDRAKYLYTYLQDNGIKVNYVTVTKTYYKQFNFRSWLNRIITDFSVYNIHIFNQK